jgi:hypothetical protein
MQRPPWTPTAYCTPDAGGGFCSFDRCFQDGDCVAGQPCLCRPSNVSGPPSVPNVCAPIGNCSVDSDCGPGGYCSPSNIGACACVTHVPCDVPDGSVVSDASPPQPPLGVGCWDSVDGGPWTQIPCTCSSPYPCGKGFYCHTPCDECMDDSDCGGAGACNYSLLDQLWECIAQDCPL